MLTHVHTLRFVQGRLFAIVHVEDRFSEEHALVVVSEKTFVYTKQGIGTCGRQDLVVALDMGTWTVVVVG